jgi:hypothetical protein
VGRGRNRDGNLPAKRRLHLRSLRLEQLEDRRLLSINLLPYTPSGWSDKIVISTVSGTHTDNSPISTTDTVYCDFAWANLGDTAAGAFYVDIYVDGSLRASYNPPSLPALSYQTGSDANMGQFGPGSHTIQMRVDADSEVSETNESDNIYTRTFNVGGTATVNLTPYKPSGWSDKIVVSNQTGTNTNNTLTTNDTLYVDWAVINNGNSATTATFITALYLDGSLLTGWQTAPGLSSSGIAYSTDWEIGTLKAGTHTLQVVTDVTGAVGETNESDNSYSVSFTVNQANTRPVIRGLPDVQFGEGGTYSSAQTTPATANHAPVNRFSWTADAGDHGTSNAVTTTVQRKTVGTESAGVTSHSLLDETLRRTYIVQEYSDPIPIQADSVFGFDGDLEAGRSEQFTHMVIDGILPEAIPLTDSLPSGTRYTVFDDWGGTWVDSEKDTQAGDDLMCWAASAANGLLWSEWGLIGGMINTDQIFQYFQDHWTDLGGFPTDAWDWWFDGTNPSQGQSGDSQVDVAGGNFYPTYDPNMYIHSRGQGTLANQYAMIDIDQYLHAGYAVNLGLLGSLGHAITVWGFNYDSGLSPSDRNYYKGIWLSESDDNKDLSNGNTAPDVLHYYEVTWDSSNLRYNFDSYYTGAYIGEVDGLDIKPPTSNDLWTYARDGETADSGLTFSIVGNTNPNAGVTITSNRYLQINPVANWSGTSEITIEVRDPQGLTTTDTFSVTVTDNTAPTVAISRQTPASSLTNADSVTFLVDFNEDVQYVDAADFTLTLGGTVTTGALSVSPGGDSDASTYIVTVQNVAGNGTLDLNFAGGQNIRDMASNAFNASTGITSEQTYTIDNTLPTISIGVPSAVITKGGPITYTVTYADANFNAITLAAGNVTLNKTGTANGTVSVSGTGLTRTITISSITGDGSLGISIVAGTASDLAGNLAPAAGPSATFVADNTLPSVTIDKKGTQADPTSSSPIEFTVVFSELVSDFITGDVTLSSSTTGGTLVGTVTNPSGDQKTYNVSVSGMAGEGTVIVYLAAGVAHDAAGNPNSTPIIIDNTVVYDPTPVTVQSIVVNGANGGGIQRSMVKSLVVSFSEIVTLDSGAFDVRNRATNAAVALACSTQIVSGKTVVTLTFSTCDQTQFGSLIDGNYQLTIDATKVHDSDTGTNLDGDNNGSFGGNKVFGAAEADKFFRLYGDYDGSRKVNNSDLAYFTPTLNKKSTDAAYLWYFDYDGSNKINNSDLAYFVNNLNKTMPF